MKIAHLINDSPYSVMIADYYEQALAASVEQDFYHFSTGEKVKYLNPRASQTSVGDFDFSCLALYDIVIVNGLNLKLGYLNACKGLKVWSVWGTEVYCSHYFHRNFFTGRSLYSRKTKRHLLNTPRAIFQGLKSDARYIKNAAEKKKALSEYDVCLCIFEEEFELIKSRLDLQQLLYWSLSVVPLESLVDVTTAPVALNGGNILLGNSATPENNHVDIIDLLVENSSENVKIICPLSYGNKEYAATISKYGREHLGDRFVPLDKFLKIVFFIY